MGKWWMEVIVAKNVKPDDLYLLFLTILMDMLGNVLLIHIVLGGQNFAQNVCKRLYLNV